MIDYFSCTRQSQQSFSKCLLRQGHCISDQCMLYVFFCSLFFSFPEYPHELIRTLYRCCALSLLQAWKLYKKGRSLEVLDPSLASSAVAEQVAMCVQIGLLCTQADPQSRPNMRRVVVMLSKKPGTLVEPTRPGYPGSRYRRSRRPTSSSTAGISGSSSSHTFESTTNSVSATTATRSAMASPRSDPRGKRPIQG